MVTDLIFAIVFGVLGCIAAFVPRTVFPFRGRAFLDTRDNVGCELVVQFVGVAFLMVAFQHLYPLLYWYL